jgi:hypothetical protein
MLFDGAVKVAGKVVTPAKVVLRGQVERLQFDGFFAGAG